MKTVLKQKEPINLEQQQNQRKNKGVKLYQNNKVMRVDGLDSVFIVKSEVNDDVLYTVENDSCNCPDFQKRNQYCKHCYATMYYISLSGDVKLYD